MLSSHRVVSLEHFVWHTQLTDLGLRLLIATQHLGLCAAAAYFVHSLSTSLISRVLVAALIALQPLFYVFAQCAGSETLGVILVTVIAAELFGIARHWPVISARRYVALALVLCCCILTRQVNRLLIIAPIAAGALLVVVSYRKKDSRRRGIAACATLAMVGLLALLWATSVTSLLCRRAQIPQRSKFGYTFLWRLNFLGNMPALDRHELLLKVAQASSPDERAVATTVDSSFAHGFSWDAANGALEVRRAVLDTNPGASEAEIDQALNGFARRFLLPPARELREAALSDFIEATHRSAADISRYLFLTTDYVNEHLASMPQAAALEQFKHPRSSLAQFAGIAYFQMWNWLSYRVCWLGVGLLACLVAFFGRDRYPSRAFAAQLGLAATGALMLLATCFFAQLQDRFIVTAMQTVLFALFAGIAGIIDAHTVPRDI
jgi:hypothetical protein